VQTSGFGRITELANDVCELHEKSNNIIMMLLCAAQSEEKTIASGPSFTRQFQRNRFDWQYKDVPGSFRLTDNPDSYKARERERKMGTE
jgi:hypothetical protein